jgi:hypothetical protein
MKTTYERGIEAGIALMNELGIARAIKQGVARAIELGIARVSEQDIARAIEQGERRAALRQMEARFGPLSPEVKQRVEALSPEALDQLLLDLLDAQTLDDIHLDD